MICRVYSHYTSQTVPSIGIDLPQILKNHTPHPQWSFQIVPCSSHLLLPPGLTAITPPPTACPIRSSPNLVPPPLCCPDAPANPRLVPPPRFSPLRPKAGIRGRPCRHLEVQIRTFALRYLRCAHALANLHRPGTCHPAVSPPHNARAMNSTRAKIAL